jgi:tetratricopeptide (TPR) repeat protein
MRLARLLPVVALQVCLCCFAGAQLTEQNWVEVKTANFVVVSNARERDAKITALRLEQFRAAFKQAFPTFRFNTAEPTTIFAVRNERTMRELLPVFWSHSLAAKPAGVFISGWERNLAVLRLDLGQQSFEVIYHEYVHELEGLNFTALPSWLSEGMAEFYGNSEVSEREVKLGIPSKRLEYLRRQSSLRIPISELLLEKEANAMKDPWAAQAFYAESWALTHMLILGPGMGKGAKMDEYIERLAKEPDGVKAFEEIFGKTSEIYLKLEHYIHQNGFNAMELKNPPEVDRLSFKTRELSAGEIATYVADLARAQGQRNEAQQRLQQALEQKPDISAAHRLQGFLFFQQGRDADARAEFEKAVGLDSKDYLSRYYVAMMQYGDPSNQAELAKLKAALKEVRTLNPNFAPAHVELSHAYVRGGQLDMALQAAKYAARLEPGHAGYHANIARILLQLGDAPGAAELARFVAERWAGTDRDQAIEIWQKAASQDKSVADRPLGIKSEAPAGTELAGMILSSRCGDTTKASEIKIRAGSQLVLLRGDTDKPMRVGFEDTLWYGHDHFSLCQHVEGRWAKAIYKPTGEAEGTLFQIRIEDDLPPMLRAPKAERH